MVLSSGGRRAYIRYASLLAMAINGAWNKRCGPGGGTRRLHHTPDSFGDHGGEIGSTRAVKTHLLPGIVPPLSGYMISANDNQALAVAA